MTLVATPPFIWPSPWCLPIGATASSFTVATLTFDSATDILAWIGTAPQALTITDVCFLTTAVATGCVVDVRIETITTGRPSGTLWAASTNANVTIASTDDNVWKTATLGASASVSAGQEFAIVVRFVSGTNATFAVHNTISGNLGANYPLMLQDTGTGVWTAQNVQPCWIVKSSSAPVFIPGLQPYSSGLETAYNSGSAADEYALKFVCPFPTRCTGAAVALSNIAAGANYRIFLWDNSGSSNTESNALASTPVISGDSTNAATNDGVMVFNFSAPVTLTAGSTYYLGVRAETANNLAIVSFPYAATAPANAIDASPTGANLYQSTRAWSAINPGTVGAWTDDTAKMPAFRLVFDQLDNGAGGGGLKVHPGMAGGMNG